MKLVEKDNPNAEPVHMPWDAAQAALASGAYEAHPIEGERGPDQPAAQSPKPGTDPKDGEEVAAEGQVLTNLTPVGQQSDEAPGLPKEPEPPKETIVKPAIAPKVPKPADL